MPERGDDGMYTSSDGTKYVHEAEADRRNTDLADGSIQIFHTKQAQPQEQRRYP